MSLILQKGKSSSNFSEVVWAWIEAFCSVIPRVGSSNSIPIKLTFVQYSLGLSLLEGVENSKIN